MAYAGDKIVYTTVKNADGHTISHTRFDTFFPYGTAWFPLHMKTLYPLHQAIDSEEIEFSNPVFDQPLPEHIIDFKIPDGVPVEERQW